MGLFDHISHIREEKTANYYTDLTDSEKKSFNHYLILMGLGMDRTVIAEVSMLYKYIDSIPSQQFYTACCGITPKKRVFVKWIKNSNDKLNTKLIEIISKFYKVNKRNAIQYCRMFLNSDQGLAELVKVCQMSGYTDDEIESFLGT